MLLLLFRINTTVCLLRGLNSHTLSWLMPKNASASAGLGSTATSPPAPTGRHFTLAGEDKEIEEQVAVFRLLSPTPLIAQVVGVATSLQAALARTPFLPVSALPASYTNYLSTLEQARDQLNVLLPSLSNALTSLIALERCLYDRYGELIGELDGVIAASRRPKRRRS